MALCIGAPAHGATCDAGYYLSGGQCAECSNGYYCPGDDTSVKCPQDTRDWTAFFTERGYRDVSTRDTVISTWSPSGLITSSRDCLSTVYAHTHLGAFLIQNAFDSEIGAYKTSASILWYRANPGYYLSHYYYTSWEDWYLSVKACTNAPAYAHYTGAGTPDATDGSVKDANNCPWECDTGHVLQDNKCKSVCADGYEWHDDGCVPLCESGIRYIKTGGGLSFNLYPTRYSTPALHVRHNDTVCYGVLAPGAGIGINVKYNGSIYHTAN